MYTTACMLPRRHDRKRQRTDTDSRLSAERPVLSANAMTPCAFSFIVRPGTTQYLFAFCRKGTRHAFWPAFSRYFRLFLPDPLAFFALPGYDAFYPAPGHCPQCKHSKAFSLSKSAPSIFVKSHRFSSESVPLPVFFDKKLHFVPVKQ